MAKRSLAVAMMQGMIDAMQMTLVLNADGTASSDLSMMGQNEKTTGTWSISGETITLNLADEGVEPEPVTGTLRGDRLEIHAQDDEMPVNMIFKRK